MPPLVDLVASVGNPFTWPWGAILLDSAIKGVAVLAMGGAVAAGCRRASASARHLVWALTVAVLCALPVLALVVPRGRVPILVPTVIVARFSSPEPEATPSIPFRAEVDTESLLRASDRRSEKESTQTIPTQHWTGWIVFIWAAGIAMVLVRLAVSLIALGRKGRRAAPIIDGSWTMLAAEIARQYGIRPRVSLRVVSAGTIPATWGIRRPLVCLPIEALDWPEDRLRAVLAHELAHVARGDFLVLVLARLACALHWFNPLAWLAERQLRVECELASDDRVLDAGLTPSDYAEHLMAVLLAARRGRPAPLGALAMGRHNGLENRLQAILDGRRSRCGLSTRRLGAMVTATACFLVLLGLVRLEARAHDAPKLERLPQGMTVEVVGISTHPTGPATWWGPDGSPLPEAPCDPFAGKVDLLAGGNGEVREIVARITGLPENAALVWHPTQCSSQGTPTPEKEGQPVLVLQRVVAEFSRGATTCALHFDIAVGAWVTEQVADRSIGIETKDRAYFFGKPREIRQGTALAIAHNLTERDVRVVALGRDGREHLSKSTSSSGFKHWKMLDVEFDLPPSEIREYRLQSRPVGRFEIQNVALQPRKGNP